MSCHNCPDFTRAQNGNTACAADACAANQVTTQAGNCFSCTPGSTPSADGRTCVAVPVVPSCNARQVLSVDGRYCVPCQDYTRAAANGRTCAADTCGANQIVTQAGTCASCTAGSIPDGTRTTCVLTVPTCAGAREALTADRRRCERCPPYTKAQGGNTYCAADACSATEIVVPSGSCARCYAGSSPDAAQRDCIRDVVVCQARERLSADLRACIACPMYTRAQNQNQICAPDSCYAN